SALWLCPHITLSYSCLSFFFFTAPPPPETYTLSLHDALPISSPATAWASIPRWSPQGPFPSPKRSGRCAIGASTCRRQCRQDKGDRKSTRLNSSHVAISYAVFCLKKKKNTNINMVK